MLRRILGVGTAVSLPALVVAVLPSVAWAAPNDVAQPTYATVGLPYSFQISDTVLGTPVKAWYSALPSGDCGPQEMYGDSRQA